MAWPVVCMTSCHEALHPEACSHCAGNKDHFVHGSRRAPRCMPEGDQDPLEESGVGWEVCFLRVSA